MADINSKSSLDALKELKDKDPAFAGKCQGKSVREQILLAGRAHPAGMAAAAELLIQEAAKLVQEAAGSSVDEFAKDRKPPVPDAVKSLAKALQAHFGNPNDIAALARMDGKPGTKVVLLEVKKDLFTDIRDAVMSVGPKNADGTASALYAKSPIFKRFSDRAIVKLDYNESAKFSNGDSAHAGTFMRPERVVIGRKMGQVYRFTSRQSADKISAGAVTEALANDLTRLAGVPAQELEIVRGKYSDGHPKIMLAAKFAEVTEILDDMVEGILRTTGQLSGELSQRMGNEIMIDPADLV